MRIAHLTLGGGEVKRELDYINIDGVIGGNQDLLPEWDMCMGGCGAVTACDVCLHLAPRFPGICPVPHAGTTTEDFIKFSRIMKPYLSPRRHGIDHLEIYICGLLDYLRDAGCTELKLEGLSGTVSVWRASEVIREQIDGGIPVPYLMLNHTNSSLEDFEWHWFNLAGYELTDSDLMVKAVTYGEQHWLSLREMWDTGTGRRGGIVKVTVRKDNI